MTAPMTKVSNPLAALLVAQHEALVERMAREVTTAQTGPQGTAAESSYWAGISAERLREGITATLTAIRLDLEAGTHDEHYSRHVATVAVPRVRGGITLRDIRAALDDISSVLRDLCRQLASPAEQIEALEHVGRIMESAWASMFANFAEAMRTAIEDAHREVISELSSPIIPIHAGILVLPLIGAIDLARGEQLTATLLPAIAREQAHGVLLDITGVPALDAPTAGWLIRIARAARLLGAEVILVGISPAIARTMVDGALDLRGLVAFGTLQAGLEHLLARRGFVIQRRSLQSQ